MQWKLYMVHARNGKCVNLLLAAWQLIYQKDDIAHDRVACQMVYSQNVYSQIVYSQLVY